MKEIYDYMSGILEKFYHSPDSSVEIDEEHFFELYHLVCYMMQIGRVIHQVEHE